MIDKRTLDSNVLIKSGDTLAIGGLLQDEVNQGPHQGAGLGDIPILGYVFQERVNARTKRNLLVFVTPTIHEARLRHRLGRPGQRPDITAAKNMPIRMAGGITPRARFASCPRRNARWRPTIPNPGVPPAPETATEVQFKSSAKRSRLLKF